MSDLGTVKISLTEYQNVETLLNTTFEEGKTYTIQVEGDVRLKETETQPTTGGFRVNFSYPFDFEYDGTNTLWAKSLSSLKDSYITVAD